jgi:hypothetical protein
VLVDWVGGLLDHRSFHDASESLMRGRAARISPYDFGSFEASHDLGRVRMRRMMLDMSQEKLGDALGLA